MMDDGQHTTILHVKKLLASRYTRYLYKKKCSTGTQVPVICCWNFLTCAIPASYMYIMYVMYMTMYDLMWCADWYMLS